MGDPQERRTALAAMCKAYLSAGPPENMTDYMPESLTEVIISHGANSLPLDPELREIASLILAEPVAFETMSDPQVRAYMQRGTELVRMVLENQ